MTMSLFNFIRNDDNIAPLMNQKCESWFRTIQSVKLLLCYDDDCKILGRIYEGLFGKYFEEYFNVMTMIGFILIRNDDKIAPLMNHKCESWYRTIQSVKLLLCQRFGIFQSNFFQTVVLLPLNLSHILGRLSAIFFFDICFSRFFCFRPLDPSACQVQCVFRIEAM